MKTKEKTGLLLGVIGITAIALLSGCIEQKSAQPTNCSAVANNFTGCSLSCRMGSDCKMTCCGCINNNEDCQTELNGENATCNLTASECMCEDGKCALKPEFDPDDIGAPSEIVTSGPIDEETVLDLAGEDKVAFFFLHNPGCSHCSAAETHLPEIQQMFGQRMVVYKLKVRDEESSPWKNIAINAKLLYFPFTLAVGANSVEDGAINQSNIGMTSSSGSSKYMEWKQNICAQFEKPPSNCSQYM